MANNLSQEELAARVGLHRNYIGHIERGESDLTVSTLLALSRELGVSPAAFFDPVTDDPPPEFRRRRLADRPR